MPRNVALTKFTKGTIMIEPPDGAGLPMRILVPITRMDDSGEIRLPGTAVFWTQEPPDVRMMQGEGHFLLPPAIAEQLGALIGKLDTYLQKLIEPKAPAAKRSSKPKAAPGRKQ